MHAQLGSTSNLYREIPLLCVQAPAAAARQLYVWEERTDYNPHAIPGGKEQHAVPRDDCCAKCIAYGCVYN